MNNEPVAWTDGRGNYFDKNSFFPVDDLIPLYTHPADLTDEEIAGAVARGWCSENNSMKAMDSDLAWAIVVEIRAILKKASEK